MENEHEKDMAKIIELIIDITASKSMTFTVTALMLFFIIVIITKM